jgi:hypothetical protein
MNFAPGRGRVNAASDGRRAIVIREAVRAAMNAGPSGDEV